MAWYEKYKHGDTALDPNTSLNFDDVIFFLSLACGTDLYPYFEQLNTTVHPRPIIISQNYTITENGTSWTFWTHSNSTVSGFHFNPEEGPFLKFNVTGREGTVGFCRVAIPKNLL